LPPQRLAPERNAAGTQTTNEGIAMKHEKTDPEGRRDFLKTGAVVGVGAAAAALLPGAAAAAPEALDTPAEDEKKGYQASQHVLDYYRTARI
jgi:nitrous oxide reductase